MLVHAKNPRGILHLQGYRIHGKEAGHKPCDIPFDLYNVYKTSLVDGTYREAYLRKLFDTTFPLVAFTYFEVRWLPEKTLSRIGPLMVADYDSAWSHKKKTDQIKVALRNVSPSA